MDSSMLIIGIVVAVITVLLSILLLYFLNKKFSKGKSILLVGLPNSGKTLMFLQLTSKQFLNTVTSMKSTENFVRLTKKSVSLIDLPGYERIRDKFWDENRSKAKGIIFVIDSVNFMSNIHDVADLLYNILADDYVHGKRIPILISCNKQDEATAKSARVIENQLKREMIAIRESRLGALDSTSDSSNKAILGRFDKEFSFGDLKNVVEFVECSAFKVGEDGEEILSDLKSVMDWLHRAA